MIDLYYSPTPNGWKIAIMLEECGLAYRPVLMDLPNGDQFKKSFLAINPNAKIPAIVDHAPQTGIGNGNAHLTPLSVFESGAILRYLSAKTGLLTGDPTMASTDMDAWLFWQASNLGPMAGQLSHFVNYAPEPMDYPLARYRGEYERCIGVLETRLAERDYILGSYSIADIMTFPWIFIAKNLGVDLSVFPAVSRWRGAIKSRPAVQRAIDLHKNAQFTDTANADSAPRLFNQTAGHLEQ